MNSDESLHQPQHAQQQPPAHAKSFVSLASFHSLKPLAIVTAVLFIAVVAGKGGYFLGTRSRQPTLPKKSTRSLSTVAQPSPSPFSPATSRSLVSTTNWKTYTNNKYRYSVKYPTNWFEFPDNEGAWSIDKYFSNKNVSSPFGMGEDGIYLTIRVQQNYSYFDKIFNNNPGRVDSGVKGRTTKLADLNINAQPAALYIEEILVESGTEYGYQTIYAIKRGTEIYTIEFLTNDKDIADKNVQLFGQIANSFLFLK